MSADPASGDAGDGSQGRWARLRQLQPGPRLSLVLLLLATAGVRIAWLRKPDSALIFDEAYYVNAARRILGWAVPTDEPYADSPAGLDPNIEHPPLGKVLIASSMRVLGDDPWGWRLPSLIAGLVVVLAVYLLVRTAGRSSATALFAAGVVALDNLLFLHSRVATLDVLFLAPLLVGAVLVLRRQWVWAGVACGIALLIKVPAAFGLLGLLVLILVLPDSGRLVERLRRALVVGAIASVVAVAGLWVLDLRYTEFDNPVQHARHISDYGLELSRETGPVNDESDPWQWLSNDVQMTYLRVDTNEVVGDEVVTTKPLVYFRGALNPALSGVALMALAYAAWRWARRRDVLAAWSVLWSLCVFLPFVFLSLISHRISYLFYALPLVPAYAVAATLMLWHEGLPRAPRWGFLAALVLGFLAYFPFREFLI